MKILLISGHGAGDPGASGNGLKEADLTVEVVKGLVPLLQPYAMVEVYPYERNAYKDISNGQLQVSFKNYDYVFEVHFNASNGAGNGVECYVTNAEKYTTVEQKIVSKLSGLGFRDRGVKRTDFLVIKTAKNKGVSSALLETCFIDNVADIKLYQDKKQQVFQAIANGIIEGFGLKKSDSTSNSTNTASKPNTTQQYLNLEPTSADRSVYNLSVNKKLGTIKPSKYGGLSYKIHRFINSRYVEISTTTFGHVAICIDPIVATGFSITSTRKFKNGD